MGMLQRLFGAGSDPQPERVEPERLALPAVVQNASPENPTSSLANPESWLLDAFGAGGSYSPVPVTETSAVRSSTVFACVSLLAGLIASLPLKVYQRTPGGRREAPEHRLHTLLHDLPSAGMNSFTWRELLAINFYLGGNGYSVIRYDRAARVTGLDWFPKSAVDTRKLTDGGKVHFVYHDDGSVEPVADSDMLHFAGPSFDGITGLSRIAQVARQSVGTELAIAEAIARTHANRALPSGQVEVPKGISAEAFKRLRAQFEAAYTGTSNAGRVVFVDQGAKFSALSLTPEDAQTIESRRFQVGDICRIFGVPPYLVGETSDASKLGSNVEQQTLSFLTFGMDRELKRFESELNAKLFAGTDFYCEFSRDALLAMDSKARSEMFRTLIQCGVMTPNEARRLQNLPPAEGGDELFMQSGTVPLRTLLQPTPPGK